MRNHRLVSTPSFVTLSAWARLGSFSTQHSYQTRMLQSKLHAFYSIQERMDAFHLPRPCVAVHELSTKERLVVHSLTLYGESSADFGCAEGPHGKHFIEVSSTKTRLLLIGPLRRKVSPRRRFLSGTSVPPEATGPVVYACQHRSLFWAFGASLTRLLCLSCCATPQSAGTLPPSFTQLIGNQDHHRHHTHHRHPSSSRYSTSRPATTSATSILAKAVAGRADNSVATQGGAGTLLSGGSRANLLFSRKRPRTSPYPEKRHGAGVNGSLSSEARLRTQGFAVVGGEGGPKDASGGDAGSGGLWGSTGLPPAGVLHPDRSRVPLETEWACPSSSVATSTTSFHDEFSDVSFAGCFRWGRTVKNGFEMIWFQLATLGSS